MKTASDEEADYSLYRRSQSIKKGWYQPMVFSREWVQKIQVRDLLRLTAELQFI